ncbi:MAG: transcriptional regulator [Sulfuritalea sp.]|nr:transcriptional regulator [Sulfuritalea sp.]
MDSLPAVFEGRQWQAVLMNGSGDSVISPSSGAFDMQEIMQYLKNNGQRFDSEIAAATGLSLAKVRRSISDLSARGEISKCSVTRFNTDGQKVEAVLCRVAGYIPPKSPGRKPGASS